MKKLSVIGGVLVLGIWSLHSATASLASPIQLVCQPEGGGESFVLTLDVDAKTVSAALGGYSYQNAPAQISDSTIGWDATATLENKANGFSRPATLDRVSGVLHQRVCNSDGCSGVYVSQCHKGEKQF